jgi:hypothetical protein
MTGVNDLPDRYSPNSNYSSVWDLRVNVLTTNNTFAGRAANSVNVPMGILKHFRLELPPGCKDHIRSILYYDDLTTHVAVILFPENAAIDGSMYFDGDNMVFEFDCFKVIPTNKRIILCGWNDGSADVHWNHQINSYCWIEQVVVP